MSDVTVKYRKGAFYDLRRLPGVVEDLESRGRRVLAAANDSLPEGRGYAMSSAQGKKVKQGRWVVKVFARSRHARHSDAVNNTLLHVMDQAK